MICIFIQDIHTNILFVQFLIAVGLQTIIVLVVNLNDTICRLNSIKLAFKISPKLDKFNDKFWRGRYFLEFSVGLEEILLSRCP